MITNLCPAKKSSPSIVFDDESNLFKVEGMSTLVNAVEFYNDAAQWITLNESRLIEAVEFQFHLPYFNSASMKGILLMMQRIKQGVDNGKKWTISWDVEDEDEFLLDAAESFQEMLELEIKIIRS